ncbi:YibE/F family protein [Clostridium celatum]|uniref:YibE/F-like protein n=1 Tax=Clostridium celatum DSM 1785 TaxID=545697 RepID=L1QCQ6_9CLOT|nr:YibE/F family protein [Clostridium celatum]EKY25746.1 YibE/F-like protein [Clostridium celatum DSM 1785]MCE9653725.1 YibE/F family protein [Clostridium celatum]MDY3361085.1 YibE/F family protein [Clostridium celatum]
MVKLKKENFKINKKNIIWIISIASLFIFLIIFNKTLSYNKPEDRPVGIEYAKAEVINIISEELEPDPDFPYINIGKQNLELKIISGERKDEIVSVNNFIGRVDNKPAKVGTKYIISSYDNFITTVIVNYSRETAIYTLVFIFMLIVIFIGGLKGIKSIFSLAVTMVCVIFLFIPLIIRGINPIIASIVIVILSTGVTMLSLNGFSKKTVVACLSCILCTAIAGVLAYLFGVITNISSFNTNEAQDLLFVAQNTSLRVKELLFAGIIIASLGAIMDTTMSITSSIFEMNEINNKLTSSQLFKSGMNIGRDVMGTMTNTLILAFTGSSINIVVIYFMYNLPYMQLINIDVIVIEIIQGLAGGIALVLSIPIAAFASSKMAVVNSRKVFQFNK